MEDQKSSSATDQELQDLADYWSSLGSKVYAGDIMAIDMQRYRFHLKTDAHKAAGGIPIEGEGIMSFLDFSDAMEEAHQERPKAYQEAMSISHNHYAFVLLKSELIHEVQKKLRGDQEHGIMGKTSPLIPVDFEMEIDGTGGLFPGNSFHSSYFSKRYKEESLFQMVGVNHIIDSSGWFTTIKGQIRAKAKKPKYDPEVVEETEESCVAKGKILNPDGSGTCVEAEAEEIVEDISGENLSDEPIENELDYTDRAGNRNAAFKLARREHGPGAVFTYEGKEYSTNYAEEVIIETGPAADDFSTNYTDPSGTYEAVGTVTGEGGSEVNISGGELDAEFEASSDVISVDDLFKQYEKMDETGLTIDPVTGLPVGDVSVEVETPTPYVAPYWRKCFLEETLITMGDNSYKPIKEIKVGDKVFTQLGIEEVLEVVSPIHNGIIEYTFSDGTKSKNTADHPYYVIDKGWCSNVPTLTNERYGIGTNDFVYGDICITDNDEQVKLISMEDVKGEFQTYTFSTNSKTYYANKILVHSEI